MGWENQWRFWAGRTQKEWIFERHLAASRSRSPNKLRPSAIATAIPYTSEAHICLGQPRRRGADKLCKINLLGWKMHCRRISSSGSTAMDWNNSSSLNFRMADTRLQRPLCNTVAFEMQLMYGGKIRRMERRHYVWHPPIFRRSVLFSHVVCKHYNNFPRLVKPPRFGIIEKIDRFHFSSTKLSTNIKLNKRSQCSYNSTLPWAKHSTTTPLE